MLQDSNTKELNKNKNERQDLNMIYVLKILEKATLSEVKTNSLNNTCYDTEGEALTSYLNGIIDNTILNEQCFDILEVYNNDEQ